MASRHRMFNKTYTTCDYPAFTFGKSDKFRIFAPIFFITTGKNSCIYGNSKH